jgi:hypothetical protein
MSKHDKLQVSDEEALSFIEPAMHIVDSRIRNLNGEPLEVATCSSYNESIREYGSRFTMD